MALYLLHVFRLYNTETFFPTHPNACSYCSAVTSHFCKTYDSVTTDRSLIVKV